MKSANQITVEQYREAFETLDQGNQIKENQRAMLIEHYRAPQRILTASQLARAVRYRSYRGVNLWYGKLAWRVAEQVGYDASAEGFTWLATLVVDQPLNEAGEIPLKLRDEVAAALELLRWV